MKGFRDLILILSSIALFVRDISPRPVANSSLEYQGGCGPGDHPAARVRRSIPEFDAVNPASLDRVDQESLPDQDDPVDHQRDDLSQFSLGDHVGNLFRSHKSAKVLPKSQDRQLQGDLPLNAAREDDNALRSDEQYECYKQQNIEPPGAEVDPRNRRKWTKGQGPRAMPIMDVVQPRRAIPSIDVAQGPRVSYVPYVRSEILKESGKSSEQKDNNQEVDSLYSNPSQQFNLKKVKSFTNKKAPSEYFLLKDAGRKVPKPLNVHANFPIYDDDIDFHPDPLQGILDERYWYDPRENEPDMRMNIDERIDGRAPFNYAHHEKRSVSEKYGKKKQYDGCYKSSKESDSPRKAIESCDSCGKGKNAKKPNSTDDSPDEGISYGRKLLFVNDESNKKGNSEQEDLLAEGYNYEDDDGESLKPKNEVAYRSRKLLSLGNVYDDNSSPLQNSKFLPQNSYSKLSSWNGKIGRKLLWYDKYDEEEESYNEEDEDLHESSDTINEPQHVQERNNRNMYYDQQEYDAQINSNDRKLQNTKYSVITETDKEHEVQESFPDEKINFAHFDHRKLDKKRPNEPHMILHEKVSGLSMNNVDPSLKDAHHFQKSSIQHMSNGDAYASNDANQKPELVSAKDVVENDIMSARNQIRINEHGDVPKIYVSNKVGDLLQKPQQEKPKGPRKNEQIDPAKEFEVMRNETFKNASMGFTTFSPNIRVGLKSIHKRGNLNARPKNRRSYTDESAIKLMPHAVDASLLQGLGMPGGGSRKETTTKTTVPTSLASDKTSLTSLAICVQNYTTTSPTNTTSNTTVAKNGDEESVDSKIANDIVEAVIAETEKGTYNHNLGVCRRNESLMNIRFGKIIPETEKVIKYVTNCIMDKIKDHLAKQSCLLLDEELIDFLKWIVLGGESYKEYEQKMGPKFFEFVPARTDEPTTCGSPTMPVCDLPGESLPPIPGIIKQPSSKDSIRAPKLSFSD